MADISRHLIDAFVKGSRDAYKQQTPEAWVANSSPQGASPGQSPSVRRIPESLLATSLAFRSTTVITEVY